MDIEQMSNEEVLKITSLKEYQLCAINLINKHAPHFGSWVHKAIKRDEDIISEITFQIMKGDMEWDGRGTRRGYRKQRAIWAIKSFLYKKKLNKKKRKILSLNFVPKVEENHLHEFYSLIPCSTEAPFDQLLKLERADLIKKLIEELPPNRQRFLELRFNENKTLREIASTTNNSHEWVRQCLIKDTQQINDKYNATTRD